MKHNLLLYRSEGLEIGAMAHVTFETLDSFNTEDKLQELITDGVTKWAQEDADGKRLYEYAADDMNIGDLSNADWGTIIPYCPGLLKVVFHEFTVPENWVYDTCLCEAPEDEDE